MQSSLIIESDKFSPVKYIYIYIYVLLNYILPRYQNTQYLVVRINKIFIQQYYIYVTF